MTLAVSAAAQRLATTPRVLRYRERLGLLPRSQATGGSHRRYDERALRAAELGVALERRYDVAPATLAFALRVVAEPMVADDVRRLAALVGRAVPSPTAVLGFEAEKARRLLREAPRPDVGGRVSPPR